MRIFLTVAFLFFALYASAQDRNDTITAAHKISYRNIPEVTGNLSIKTKEASKIISPLGEGDPIKYIQTLSGVSSGPEGSSAIYVRGSGAGNTVLTVDGVPVYGITHMLGLTTIIPQDIVSDIQFYKDGFGNGLSGYTGSQLNLYTKDGDLNKAHAGLSVNSFLPGVFASIPIIEKKTSLLFAARMSPLEQEFNMAKGLFKKNGLGIDSLKTKIYDLFAKITHRFSPGTFIALSGMYSNDGYNYITDGLTNQDLSWTNKFLQLRFVHRSDNFDIEAAAYYNNYSSVQEKTAWSNQTFNFLSAKSEIKEKNLRFNFNWHPVSDFKLNSGFNIGRTDFMPGTNKVIDVKLSDSGKEALNSYKGSLFVQGIYSFFGGRTTATLGIKGSIFKLDDYSNFGPEYYASLRYNIFSGLYIDLSASHTAQYTHTLEGMPLGWSTDLIVPSNSDIAPEKANQFSAGLYFTPKSSTLYIGGYYKDMSNLIFYTDATELFGARRELWMDYLDFGNGTSRGLEMEYSFDTKRLHFRGAYTLSKTDRSFANTNFGKSFPAKYDRRHMFNASAEWIVSYKESSQFSITGAATVQNGHWDTVNADQYGVPTIEQFTKKNPVDFLVDYCSGVNNYRHPMYIRFDVGCKYEFHTGKTEHSLFVGAYNALNRHNPFSIYYDTDESRWKRLSLIPFLPNFSYKVLF